MTVMTMYDRVSSSLRMSACLHQTLSEWLTSSSVLNITGHNRSKSIFYDLLVIMLYILNIDEFINHYMESGLCKMKCSIGVGPQSRVCLPFPDERVPYRNSIVLAD